MFSFAEGPKPIPAALIAGMGTRLASFSSTSTIARFRAKILAKLGSSSTQNFASGLLRNNQRNFFF
ncbi:hypothetical protein N9493_04120 [Amylibacter sp.]|nr:hypothetical protein [Amylibacter sp.]